MILYVWTFVFVFTPCVFHNTPRGGGERDFLGRWGIELMRGVL